MLIKRHAGGGAGAAAAAAVTRSRCRRCCRATLCPRLSSDARPPGKAMPAVCSPPPIIHVCRLPALRPPTHCLIDAPLPSMTVSAPCSPQPPTSAGRLRSDPPHGHRRPPAGHPHAQGGEGPASRGVHGTRKGDGWRMPLPCCPLQRAHRPPSHARLQTLTAFGGIDALVHSLESYVSVFGACVGWDSQGECAVAKLACVAACLPACRPQAGPAHALQLPASAHRPSPALLRPPISPHAATDYTKGLSREAVSILFKVRLQRLCMSNA